MYQQALEKVSKQVLIRDRYENFIGGKWVAPTDGKYFENPSPITGKRLCNIPRSTAADIELALDAAHKAKDAWGRTSVQERSRILNKIADKLESNLELLALVETLDNGKPIRETTYADMPLVVDFRNAALLGAHHAGEIAPMVDDQRHVGMGRFADRLAVVEGLDEGEQFEIGFQLVGDLVEDA